MWFFFGFTVGMLVMNSVNKELNKKGNENNGGDNTEVL